MNRFGLVKGKVKHNFDKRLSNTSGIGLNNPTPVQLYLASFPSVLLGIVINGTVTSTTTTMVYQWYLMIVREGETAPTPTFNPAVNVSSIKPEEHVMAFGSGIVSTTTFAPCECKTKTGRKMMSGDSLYFIFAHTPNAGGDNISYSFVIQWFIRT